MASKAKADETKSSNKESESTTATDAAVEPESPPETPKRSVRDRIKDIEKRWGKEFTEVMADLHDHVFGTSDLHDGEKKED